MKVESHIQQPGLKDDKSSELALKVIGQPVFGVIVGDSQDRQDSLFLVLINDPGECGCVETKWPVGSCICGNVSQRYTIIICL